jgi:hypothetical protein
VRKRKSSKENRIQHIGGGRKASVVDLQEKQHHAATALRPVTLLQHEGHGLFANRMHLPDWAFTCETISAPV